MQESIKQILMRRDGISSASADNLICQAQEALFNCLDEDDQDAAENVCSEYFSLEPDYIDELI